MKKILLILLVSAIVIWLSVFRGDDAALSPSEVDDSMIGTVVRVSGEIEYSVIDPLGQGGLYMILDENGTTIDVRIQPRIWDNYSDDEKAGYRVGRIVTVKGVLVRAGEALVVVHGSYP